MRELHCPYYFRVRTRTAGAKKKTAPVTVAFSSQKPTGTTFTVPAPYNVRRCFRCNATMIHKIQFLGDPNIENIVKNIILSLERENEEYRRRLATLKYRIFPHPCTFFQSFVLSLKNLIYFDWTLRSRSWLLNIRPTAPLYVAL
jgi:hypothetical protein